MCEAIRFFDPRGRGGPQMHRVMYSDNATCYVEGEHGRVKLDRGARYKTACLHAQLVKIGVPGASR